MQPPQLQLYNRIFEQLQGLGVTVIDVKDQFQELPYPFLVVSNLQHRKTIFTNDSFNGDVNIKVDIWSDANDKGRHFELYQDVDDILSNLRSLDGYIVKIDDVLTDTIIDTTTDGELLHSTIVTNYNLY